MFQIVLYGGYRVVLLLRSIIDRVCLCVTNIQWRKDWSLKMQGVRMVDLRGLSSWWIVLCWWLHYNWHWLHHWCWGRCRTSRVACVTGTFMSFSFQVLVRAWVVCVKVFGLRAWADCSLAHSRFLYLTIDHECCWWTSFFGIVWFGWTCWCHVTLIIVTTVKSVWLKLIV